MSPYKRFPLYIALVVLTIASLACSLSVGPQGLNISTNDTPATAQVVATAEAPVASQPTAPAAQANDVSAQTYKVEGKSVTVYGADGKTVLATITFDVDAPTEWLKGRDGVHYLFQSGINRKVKVTIKLNEGAAFATDGDWMSYAGNDLGKINDSSDYLAFGDQPGTYTFTASSFGLAVGPYRSAEDKAGFVLDDRKAATNDARPVYWLDPTGKVVDLGK